MSFFNDVSSGKPTSNRFGQLSDALRIWQAGVEAVDPFRLIERAVRLKRGADRWEIRLASSEQTAESNRTRVEFLSSDQKIWVVGMGKASARMALGLEAALNPLVDAGRVAGWLNVPDDPISLETPLRSIRLFGARPPQVNEPTEQGVWGSRRMVEFVQAARPDDLIFCLISGGGSALAPLPIPEISLDEKRAITRFLSAGGANIAELNAVRKELSLLKGGGLRRFARNKRFVALILSDVLGDPLDVIASGATVESRSTASDACDVLRKFRVQREPRFSNVFSFLETKSNREKREGGAKSTTNSADFSRHFNQIVGGNATAVRAAARKATELGYRPFFHAAGDCEGDAEIVGRSLLDESLRLFSGAALDRETSIFQSGTVSDSSVFLQTSVPISRATISRDRFNCVVSGGEPTVRLVAESERGIGGRNQQLVLAALIDVLEKSGSDVPVCLSAGTDGEDGPTDAAGAFFDRRTIERIRATQTKKSFEPLDFLHRNDAWSFFGQIDALLKTGATGTNVCDLRILLQERDRRDFR